VETAANYITYLEKAKLIIVQPVYSSNTAKTLRANKKLHVLDNGICNAMNRLSNPDDARLGQAVETAMTAYAAHEAEKNVWQVCYRDIKEVDIVLDQKNTILPIEVKYRNEVRTGKNENWQDLGGTQPVVVITKTYFKKEGNVLYIPFWLVK
jgi:predicted AAA+ superfamily ATPase